MIRREMLGTSAAGLAAVGTGWLAASVAAAQDPKREDHQHAQPHAGDEKHSQVMDACAKACGNAIAHCTEAILQCEDAEKEKAAAHAHALRMVIDCQAICSLTSDFAARHSPVAGPMHAACAEICNMCAEACARVGDSEVMKDCAEKCRECAAHCEEMKGQKAAHH